MNDLSRFSFHTLDRKSATESLCEAVHRGLLSVPKATPPRFLYDRRGSELFERITRLPEYYLTRCEQSILDACAATIVDWAPGPEIEIVEFGSGSSRKTRLLIDAALEQQSRLRYVPIDISEQFLRASAADLLDHRSGLEVLALAGEYFDALDQLPEARAPRLILFLGSNIGNFERAEAARFLTGLARAMGPGDRALIGIDLVKDRSTIEAAYNDAEGVTAAFNKNLLARINRDLRAGFDLASFDHHAPYLEERRRIEMRLVSRLDQEVSIGALDLVVPFAEGEVWRTESCHKFSRQGFGCLCRESGLEPVQGWIDDRGWFSLEGVRRA
jgi:L-histidine Nalpha-methyltransferase